MDFSIVCQQKPQRNIFLLKEVLELRVDTKSDFAASNFFLKLINSGKLKKDSFFLASDLPVADILLQG